MAGAPKRAGAAKRPAVRRAAPKRALAAGPGREPVEPVPPPARAAVPEAEPEPKPADEPVWLVRIVLVLFLVGFAAFLAREVYSFVQSLP